jgi:hypothetical protein
MWVSALDDISGGMLNPLLPSMLSISQARYIVATFFIVRVLDI